MKGVFVLAAAVASLLGIAIACGTSPVIVGKFECVISDAGDNTHVCPEKYFCETACDSTVGQCKPIQSTECALSGPQCGCDKITYYNACVREEAHVSPAASGQCGATGVAPCGRADDCPGENRGCAYIIPVPFPTAFCSAAAALGPPLNMLPTGGGGGGGICWSLPDGGSPRGARQVSTLCGECKDDLLAIRSGGLLYTCLSSDASAD